MGNLHAKLLTSWLELFVTIDDDVNALHRAAERGHEKLVARLLVEHPDWLDATTRLGWTALLSAAARGHDRVVAQLLTAGAQLDVGAMNVLHVAAGSGHGKVVAWLLAAHPSLITTFDDWGGTALSHAVESGHEEVFTQLLAACPELIDRDAFILHVAVRHGQDNLVARIASLCPEKLFVRDHMNGAGFTALEEVILLGRSRTAERLLAIKPELVFERAPHGQTLLHLAIAQTYLANSSCEFVEKLWRMNPGALRKADDTDSTPFHDAIGRRDDLVELFQWCLSFDEIVAAFTQQKVEFPRTI